MVLRHWIETQSLPKQKTARKRASRTKKSPKPPRLVAEGDDGSNIGTQVLFPEDSAELDQHARRVLDDIDPDAARKIQQIEIRGHSNGRRLPRDGPYKNLWELSYARSFATMRYLIEKGIESAQDAAQPDAPTILRQIAGHGKPHEEFPRRGLRTQRSSERPFGSRRASGRARQRARPELDEKRRRRREGNAEAVAELAWFPLPVELSLPARVNLRLL